MLRRLAVVGSLTTVGMWSPALAFAAPGPVTNLTVVPWADSASVGVNLSWTYSDPSATGAVMCAKKGDQPALTPDACDIKWAKSQGETTGTLRLAQAQTYSFSVFAYQASGGQRDYAAPETTSPWDGTRLEFPLNCMTVTYGEPCHFTSSLHDTYVHAPASEASVQLWRNSSLFGSANTDGTGTASIGLALRKPASLQWQFQGGNGLLGAFTDTHDVNLAFKLTAHLTTHSAVPGQRVKIYGVVAPETTNTIYITEPVTTGSCPGRSIVGRATAKQQRLPNGQMAYGYVILLPAATIGKHSYSAHVDRDHAIQGATTRDVYLTVGAAGAVNSRAAQASDPGQPLQTGRSPHRLRSC